MMSKSYAAALKKVLEPLGFQREGYDWVRVRGDMREWVNVQVSSIAGTTANLCVMDLETERVIRSIPCAYPLPVNGVSERIGHLMDGYDHWWTKESGGSDALAEAVATHAPSFFDKVRTLEDQMANWYGGFDPKKAVGASTIFRAITLYRLGRMDDALASLVTVPRRHQLPTWPEKVECVRVWLEAQRTAKSPGG